MPIRNAMGYEVYLSGNTNSIVQLDSPERYKKRIGLNKLTTFTILGDLTFIQSKIHQLKDYTIKASGDGSSALPSIKIVISEMFDTLTPSQAVLNGMGEILGGQAISLFDVFLELSVTLASGLDSHPKLNSNLMPKKKGATQWVKGAVKDLVNQNSIYCVRFMLLTPEREHQASLVIDTGKSEFKFGQCHTIARQANKQKIKNKQSDRQNAEYQQLMQYKANQKELQSCYIAQNAGNNSHGKSIKSLEKAQASLLSRYPQIQLTLLDDQLIKLDKELGKITSRASDNQSRLNWRNDKIHQLVSKRRQLLNTQPKLQSRSQPKLPHYEAQIVHRAYQRRFFTTAVNTNSDKPFFKHTSSKQLLDIVDENTHCGGYNIRNI